MLDDNLTIDQSGLDVGVFKDALYSEYATRSDTVPSSHIQPRLAGLLQINRTTPESSRHPQVSPPFS